jgi:hypothetical protein
MEILLDVINAGLKEYPDSDVSSIEDGDFEATNPRYASRRPCSDSAVSYVSDVSSLGMKFFPLEMGNIPKIIQGRVRESIPRNDMEPLQWIPPRDICAPSAPMQQLCADYQPKPYDVVRYRQTHLFRNRRIFCISYELICAFIWVFTLTF